MKKIKTYKLFLEQEETLDYNEASNVLGLDRANEINSDLQSFIKSIEEKKEIIAKYKDEFSNYLSENKDKNGPIDDAFVNMDLVNRNLSDLSSNLDSVSKSLKKYVSSDGEFEFNEKFIASLFKKTKTDIVALKNTVKDFIQPLLDDNLEIKYEIKEVNCNFSKDGKLKSNNTIWTSGSILGDDYINYESKNKNAILVVFKSDLPKIEKFYEQKKDTLDVFNLNAEYSEQFNGTDFVESNLGARYILFWFKSKSIA